MLYFNQNMAILSTTEREILQTVSYFDIFEFPLTEFEIYKNLIAKQPVTFAQVKKSFVNLKTYLEFKDGFYFLPGKESLIASRKQKFPEADRKFKIAKKNAELLRRLPLIKAIFVCNSLAYSNTRAASDIDLFIITRKNRVWTARFYATLAMKLLNRRPRGQNTADKICLSFFCDETALNLKSLTYENDIYLHYWINQLSPLWDPDNLLDDVRRANSWTKDFLPNFFATKNNARRALNGKKFLQKITSAKASLIAEKTYRAWQEKHLPKELAPRGKDVVFNNQIIKLHATDRRIHYRDLWLQKCAANVPKINIKDLAKIAARGIGV
jgi:hypothetical protein